MIFPVFLLLIVIKVTNELKKIYLNANLVDIRYKENPSDLNHYLLQYKCENEDSKKYTFIQTIRSKDRRENRFNSLSVLLYEKTEQCTIEITCTPSSSYGYELEMLPPTILHVSHFYLKFTSSFPWSQKTNIRIYFKKITALDCNLVFHLQFNIPFKETQTSSTIKHYRESISSILSQKDGRINTNETKLIAKYIITKLKASQQLSQKLIDILHNFILETPGSDIKSDDLSIEYLYWKKRKLHALLNRDNFHNYVFVQHYYIGYQYTYYQYFSLKIISEVTMKHKKYRKLTFKNITCFYECLPNFAYLFDVNMTSYREINATQIDKKRCNRVKKSIYCRKSTSNFCQDASRFDKYPQIGNRKVITFFTFQNHYTEESGCKNRSKEIKYDDKIYCILFEGDINETVTMICNPHLDNTTYPKLNVYILWKIRQKTNIQSIKIINSTFKATNFFIFILIAAYVVIQNIKCFKEPDSVLKESESFEKSLSMTDKCETTSLMYYDQIYQSDLTMGEEYIKGDHEHLDPLSLTKMVKMMGGVESDNPYCDGEDSDTNSLMDNPYPGSDSYHANRVYSDTYEFGNIIRNSKYQEDEYYLSEYQ